jgi:hypothetical protein
MRRRKYNMHKELKPLAVGLASHCGEQLGFERPPKLFLKQDEENSSKMLGKTAHYDPDRESVTIYTTGRHPKDVLRSLAHELVHHHQNLRGDLSPEKCGEISKNYAQDNEHMRNMEKEAYLVGNILFRDWEDSHTNVHLKESKNMYKLTEEEKRILEKISFSEILDPHDTLDESEEEEEEEEEEATDESDAIVDENLERELFKRVAHRILREQADEDDDIKEATLEGPDQGAHPCYVHIKIKENGEEGKVIPGTHTLFEDGTITHYDVEFSDRIEENIPINDLAPILVEKHSDCPVCPDTMIGEDEGYGRDDDEIKNEGVDHSIGLEKTRRLLAGKKLVRRVIPKLEEGAGIVTPEQEETLYQKRFGPRNAKLFDKLTKSWTK